MRQYIGAVRAKNNILSPHKNCTFKFHINFDRHNAGLKFNYCLRFDPPNFSLPSTLKVPKREIFVTEFFMLSDLIWIGDLRTKPKKPFV
jgi:hypothetical protein